MLLKKKSTEDTQTSSSPLPERRREVSPSLSMKDLMKTAEKIENIKSVPQDAAPNNSVSLQLRANVQQRLAYIISKEFCNEELKVEIKNDISLTFLTWKEVSERWMIPRKAKNTFKAVSCNVVMFVGTNALRRQGLSALLELDLNDFHKLFNPFTVSMGSSECMEAWMLSTNPLVVNTE